MLLCFGDCATLCDVRFAISFSTTSVPCSTSVAGQMVTSKQNVEIDFACLLDLCHVVKNLKKETCE